MEGVWCGAGWVWCARTRGYKWSWCERLEALERVVSCLPARSGLVAAVSEGGIRSRARTREGGLALGWGPGGVCVWVCVCECKRVWKMNAGIPMCK